MSKLSREELREYSLRVGFIAFEEAGDFEREQMLCDLIPINLLEDGVDFIGEYLVRRNAGLGLSDFLSCDGSLSKFLPKDVRMFIKEHFIEGVRSAALLDNEARLH